MTSFHIFAYQGEGADEDQARAGEPARRAASVGVAPKKHETCTDL